ncbi:MAG: 2-C-methyl-D-erythritol 2,4-cyclodiphosphate synthase [Selenomonadaceae bacterium]|nr:2-C-methyl-D-erythritol 2,4-cyclodiphosphate synthase [Selenomonadaceae bacterium]MBQ6757837.1 2-C-methyl-D-erythritol 2,4-cyclodiphosphate synthase [Selenomonadaceae bacterium]MBR0103699.1 2-C-methyl-D-erythritol 2,4-cyclodiphosphate synthase [Selenomonadaceae bacterium]
MIRFGIGYDVHRLVPNRKLILGGVEIEHPLGLEAHSDGDVLIHAIIDALLGAATLGDIGQHFPMTPEFKDVSSVELLRRTRELIAAKGYSVGNVDSIIVAQRPKLAPHILSMRERLAQVLQVELDAVSVKAKTEERLGFTGNEQGISAYAVASLER